MSNQIRKNGVIYSQSGGGQDHEKMSNRRGAGPDGEAWHLNLDEYRYVQATMAGAPLTPTNLSPADGETNVYQFPEFTGSAYVSPRDAPMLGIEIRIAEDTEQTAIVYEGYAETSQTSARFPEFEALIAADAAYFWSIRYADAEGRRGNWSVPTGFTTAAAFEPTVVLRPDVTYPAEGARVSPSSPMLITSPFRVEGETDSHESTDWQIASRADFDESHVLAESLDDGENKTAVIFQDLDLSGEKGFYARARHKGALAGKSPWSPTRRALLKEFHDDFLIGVGITEGGAVFRIDGEGNRVTTRGDYFDRHPLFQFPRAVVADQYMRALQETHVRCDSDAGGFKYRYWISPSPFGGSAPHPAFALSPAGPLLLGEYLSGNDANSGKASQLNSQPGKYVRNLGIGTPSAAWLNTGGDAEHAGWGAASVWDRSLLTLLMLTEWATLRFDSRISLNVPSGTADAAGRGSFRGLTHPFFNNSSIGVRGNTGEFLDGLNTGSITSATRQIGTPTDLATFVNVPKTTVSVSGGEGYGQTAGTLKTGDDPALGSLQLLFLPDAVNSGGLGLAIYGAGNLNQSAKCAFYGMSGSAGSPFPLIYACTGTSNSDGDINTFARLVKRTV